MKGLVPLVVPLFLATQRLKDCRAASISKPIRNDSEIEMAMDWSRDPDHSDSATLARTVAYHTRPRAEEHLLNLKGDATLHSVHSLGSGNPTCPLELELLWSTQLGGPVSSTPLVRRSMFADGGVQLVVPTFVRYVELIDGEEGLAPVGWPLAFDVEDRQGGGEDDDEGQGDDEFRTSPHRKDVGVGGGGRGRRWSSSDTGPALFHGGAAVHDVNRDGVDDVCVVDGDGNVYWVAVGAYGKYLHDYRISVPKLKVRRDWHDGLDLDFTDSYVELSMFHHEESESESKQRGDEFGDDYKGRMVRYMSRGGSGGGGGLKRPERIGEDLHGGGVDDDLTRASGGARPRRAKQADTLAAHTSSSLAGSGGGGGGSGGGGGGGHSWGGTRRTLLSNMEETPQTDSPSPPVRPRRRRRRRRLLEEEADEKEKEGQEVNGGGGGEEVFDDELDGEEEGGGGAGGGGMEFGDDARPTVDFGDGGSGDDIDNFGHGDDGNDLYGGGGGDNYGGNGGGRGRAAVAAVNGSNYVLIDAHVLGTPTVADVNNDGHVEIILGVSYFFDKTKYPPGPNRALGGADPSKYVAGGVACYDLQTQDWVWKVHLDLTTDHGTYKAHVFGSPTVADLDGDGKFEVVLGTGLGLLYVLDAESGFVVKGFPMQFGVISTQIAVADVVVPGTESVTPGPGGGLKGGHGNSSSSSSSSSGSGGNGGSGGKVRDGDLEMVFGDARGNLLCVSRDGKVLWDRQLPGLVGATPTIGDVDGDGFVDVAVTVTTFTTGASVLFVVRGQDGSDLRHFPVKLSGDQGGLGLLAPSVLLVDLHESSAGLAAPPINNVGQASRKKSAKEPRLRGVRSLSSSAEQSGGEGGEEEEEEEEDLAGGTAAAPMGGWKSGSLHLVTPTAEGKLLVVEGGSGCVNKVDVGGHVYAMPLAEDLQGDGLVDLVVATMSGELMAFGTSVPYHPLNSWVGMPGGGAGRNGFTHGRRYGVFLYDMGGRKAVSGDDDDDDDDSFGLSGGTAKGSHDVREVVGRFISVTFEIVDARQTPLVQPEASARSTEVKEGRSEENGGGDEAEEEANKAATAQRYSVTLSEGSNSVTPLLRVEYSTPGLYTVEVELDGPTLTTIVVLVVNEHGQACSTSFTVSYNRHFYRYLKWIAALPLLLVSLPLLATPEKRWNRGGREETELPS